MLYLLLYILISFFPVSLDIHEKVSSINKTSSQAYSIDFMMGRTNESDTSFKALPAACVSYGTQYMQKQAADSFLVMFEQAKKEDIKLTVISAYRSYDVQKWLWDSAWNKYRSSFSDDKLLVKHILKYLSMPGTSRHHWGTEVDVCSTTLVWWQSQYGQKTYQWLNEHAGRYGFYQPYGKLGDTRKTGYQEEKWHWSFVPVAENIQQQYADSVKYSNFTGFKGAQYASDIGVIPNYVLSVEAYVL